MVGLAVLGSAGVLCLTIAAAILRHRLYDLDRIMSRTVAYGLLTGGGDRRFNRRRYDAARTVEGFAARLRDQVDLDALHAELLAVVEGTMHPTQASLWLRPQQPSRPRPPQVTGNLPFAATTRQPFAGRTEGMTT